MPEYRPSIPWWPETLAQACTTQPLAQPVPADDAAFRKRKGLLKLALRTARRQCLLDLSGQRASLRTRLDPAWRRALWIHEGMPQIGDAMMDLAPRSLLAAHGIGVDLYAPPHIGALFAADPWLGRTLSSAEDVRAADYDFAIVLNHDHRASTLKRERLPGLPWVCLQGFYGGPDFHRARFATRRLAELLGDPLSPRDWAWHSAQKLQAGVDASRWAAEQVPAVGGVALALGGVWAERTYHRWSEVCEILVGRDLGPLLLVGAENGRALADELLVAVAGRLPVLDWVGRASLPQAHALFARAGVAVCADGGLMHLALATPTPTIALFNSAIHPAWRLPVSMRGASLQSAGAAVDGVAPHAIAEAILAALLRKDDLPPATSDAALN